jgi:hypothetical protein
MTFDPEKFESPTKFDPAEFNVPANDTKGHGVLLHFRAPHQFQRSMQVVVASRKFPYTTVSDLIRHALLRHLDWLTEIADIAPAKSLLSVLHTSIDHMRDEEIHREQEDHFARLQSRVDDLMATPDGANEARRIIAREIDRVREAPESFYRDRYLGKLERHFGTVLGANGRGRTSLRHKGGSVSPITGKVKFSEDGGFDDAEDAEGREN